MMQSSFSEQNAGKLITIEGVEGVGKSTAIAFLKKLMDRRGIRYVVTREPGGTILAEKVRALLLSHHEENLTPYAELFLMFASRAQHMAHVVLPSLSKGYWVVSDRFTDASFAYQGGGRQIPAERIALLAQWIGADVVPHLTLLLDAPLSVGFDRMKNRKKDRIEAEKIDFFEKVRKTYLDLAEQHPQRYRVIQADRSLKEVENQLKNAMAEIL